jgi:hypothetical protein
MVWLCISAGFFTGFITIIEITRDYCLYKIKKNEIHKDTNYKRLLSRGVFRHFIQLVTDNVSLLIELA